MFRKLATLVALVALIPLAVWGQSVRGPTVTSAVLVVSNTAGTVLNGGHAVSVVAGTKNALANQNDCSSPGFAACNFLYANSVGTVAITQTLATAAASGNVLLAIIETNGTVVTRIAYPNQSGTTALQALGPLATFSSAPVPTVAAGVALGSGALPFESLYVGTAATNNIRIDPLATAAARTIVLADQGAAGAFAIADPAGTTKVLNINLAGQTAATTVTLTTTTTADRAITIADPGGAATLAYTNPTTAQTITNTTYTSGAAAPALAGVVRLGNTELIDWRDQAGGANISLGVNAANNLVLTGATAPTDGYYFVAPGNCGLTLTTGTWAANVGAGTGAAALPGLVRAAAGNHVLQGTTSAAANTFVMDCDITPPTRVTALKGVTITAVDYLFGYQTTALTSIGTAATSSVTYGAAGAAAAGTVAAIGGALTVTPGTDHVTPGAVTTTGQCYHEKLAFGTPYAVVVDNTRLTLESSFLQSAAASTIMQVCGAVVYFSNINAL